MSRKQLSELSGVAQVSIAQYELGKRQPRVDQLTKIAAALAVDPFVLVRVDSYPEERDKAWLEEADPIYKFLASLGYTVNPKPDRFQLGAAAGNNERDVVVLKSADGKSVAFSKEEFKELQTAAKDVVDTRFYKKLMETKTPPISQ